MTWAVSHRHSSYRFACRAVRLLGEQRRAPKKWRCVMRYFSLEPFEPGGGEFWPIQCRRPQTGKRAWGEWLV